MAVYYPIPEYRSMGDGDFLVWEKDYHYALEKNGVVFELHRRPAKLPEDKGRKLLMEYIHEKLNHREWHQIDEYQIPALPWLPNGLVLLYHIRQHLVNGMGLRQIIDWMMCVERERRHLVEVLWNCFGGCRAKEESIGKRLENIYF